MQPTRQNRWGQFVLILLLVTLPWGVRPVLAADEGQDALPEEHIVRFDETLSEIAKAYGVSMSDLMQINGIDDPDTVYVGQRLRLPSDIPVEAPAGDQEDAEVGAESLVNRPVTATLNRTYTVQLGDHLNWIALRFGVDVASLRALNGLTGSDTNVIATGQVLLLPATQQELRVAAPVQEHTVTAGESLSGIAKAYGVSLAELMTANHIDEPDSILIGQKLAIPAAGAQENEPLVGPPRQGFRYHRVRPGETLSLLAEIYDTTPQAIVRYNGLPDEATVYTGLEVRIPYGPPPLPQRIPRTRLSGTRFLISISRQRCWLFQGSRALYEWKCSTGHDEWVTRTGTFPVKTKLEMAQSSAYRLDMPYWLGLYDVGNFENGIHGIPVAWGTGRKIWTSLVGQPATFGCAMLLDEDAAELFRLAYIGMPVHIID